MSLAELIPLVNNLSQLDKLSLFKHLATQIPDAERQVIFSTSEYPIWSPYDATEAANILMQMIQDDQEVSPHA
jgi:hypothetical protein